MRLGRMASIAAMVVAGCAIALGAAETRAPVEAADVTPVPAVGTAAMASSLSNQTTSVHARRQLWMEVTAYCPCTKCCGPQAAGVTASGLPVSHNQGRFVAADTKVLPFGSKLVIPGYHDNTQVPVIDRGGAIKGARLDVYFPTHQEALNWGRRWVMVTVAE